MVGLRRAVYRFYRRGKQWSLRNSSTFRAKLFFRMLLFVESSAQFISARKAANPENQEWLDWYREKYPHPLFRVETLHPIAAQSADHQCPRGAQNDSSKNLAFNRRCYALLGNKADFRLLDLGCAGGGLVRTVLEDGFLAVGLEGSDIARKTGHGEWPLCFHHLFTCDIARPFTVFDDQSRVMAFDVVTAWEVLEHIPEELLPGLIDNIRRHLLPGGFFIASVDTSLDGNPLNGAVYHVTLKEKSWWMDVFSKAGFAEFTNHSFEPQEFIRGHGLGMKDWDPADGEGFHLVLRYQGDLNAGPQPK